MFADDLFAPTMRIAAMAPPRPRPIDWSALVFALERVGMSQRQIAEACGYESHTSVWALKNIDGTEPKFHQGALLLGLWMERLSLPAERATGPRGHPIAVWHRGSGEAAAGLRLGAKMRPWAGHIAFATVWRELEDGSSVPAIVRETGASAVSVYRLLKVLRPIVHIAAWEKDAVGRASTAVWMLGTRPDIRKPKPKRSGEKSAERAQRAVHRVLDGTRNHERFFNDTTWRAAA